MYGDINIEFCFVHNSSLSKKWLDVYVNYVCLLSPYTLKKNCMTTHHEFMNKQSVRVTNAISLRFYKYLEITKLVHITEF